jgi:hypothetical protein
MRQRGELAEVEAAQWVETPLEPIEQAGRHVELLPERAEHGPHPRRFVQGDADEPGKALLVGEQSKQAPSRLVRREVT